MNSPRFMAARDSGWRIVILVVFLALWELGVETGLMRDLWTSRPSKIVIWLIREVPTADFMNHLWVTTKETILGLALGSVAGLLTGFALSTSHRLYRVVEPFVMVLYSLPRVALAPLFIVWFGIGEASKVALAFSLVYFVMLFNAHEGVQSVRQELISAVRTMGASRYFIYRRVIAPASVPFIVAGLRVSIGLALIGVIVGEMLAARAGLGQQLAQGASLFRTDAVFGVIVVLALMALVANSLMNRLERRLLHWRPGIKA